MPEELWTEVCDIVQEAVIKTIPKKMKCKKTKLFSDEAIQIAEKREGKGKRKRKPMKYVHWKAEFQRVPRRDKKAFLHNHCKEIRKTIEWERLEISSRKLELSREDFMQRWANKGQKWYGPNRSRRY